jgi:hypothetical protein
MGHFSFIRTGEKSQSLPPISHLGSAQSSRLRSSQTAVYLEALMDFCTRWNNRAPTATNARGRRVDLKNGKQKEQSDAFG